MNNMQKARERKAARKATAEASIAQNRAEKQAGRLQQGFPSIMGPAFGYEPIKVDSLEETLSRFYAEREEREEREAVAAKNAEYNAEYKDLAEKILSDCTDALNNTLKVKEITPTVHFGNPKPYLSPAGEETGRAWAKLLETVSEYMPDGIGDAKPEIEQRLKNLLEAVRLDWNKLTGKVVEAELKARGYC